MDFPVGFRGTDGLGENIQDGVIGFVVHLRETEAIAGNLAMLAGG